MAARLVTLCSAMADQLPSAYGSMIAQPSLAVPSQLVAPQLELALAIILKLARSGAVSVSGGGWSTSACLVFVSGMGESEFTLTL